MNFYSMTDFHNETENIFADVKNRGEVVITNDGKPAVLMMDISDGDFDDVMRVIRQARAMLAFQGMRNISASHGYMSEDDIEAEINASRVERRQR